MATNLYRQFLGLIPKDPTLVVQVITHNGDGRTSLVEFPNGSQTIVQGQAVDEGSYAFIRGGEIVSEAPAVSPITIDV